MEVSRLCDALWGDTDGDQAQQAFTNALHRLRKLLGADDALLLRAGRLSLNPLRCWVDVWALERLVEGSDRDAGPERTLVLLRQIYRGKLLARDDPHMVYVRCRDRYHAQFLRVAARLGKKLQAADRTENVVTLAEHVLEADEAQEPFHGMLIRAYLDLGRVAEAQQAHRRCEIAMQTHYRRKPASDIQGLLRAAS